MAATSWWDLSLEPQGDLNPDCKPSLPALVILCRLPSFSARGPESLALEAPSPKRGSLLGSLTLCLWVEFGQWEVPAGTQAGERAWGVSSLFSPCFGDVPPEVAISSLTTAPPGSLSSAVPVQNGLRYHF